MSQVPYRLRYAAPVNTFLCGDNLVALDDKGLNEVTLMRDTTYFYKDTKTFFPELLYLHVFGYKKKHLLPKLPPKSVNQSCIIQQQDGFFSLKINPKSLDPSYTCFGMARFF